MKRCVFTLLITLITTGSIFATGGDMGVGTEPLTDGSSDYPYLIEDFADFEVFADSANSATYWASGVHTRLECDPNLDPALGGRQIYTTAVIASDTDNTNYEFDGTSFEGIFDGNGHIINNLTINTAGAGNDYLGLFGYIASSSAEIENLGLENVDISSADGSYYLGGLCGRNYGTITSCYTTGAISGYHCVGGLVGENIGAVTSCYATSMVSGSSSVAGLVGYHNSGTITACYTTSAVSGSGHHVGGLVGYKTFGTITASFWDIQTTGQAGSGAGKGLTTAQMKMITIYQNAGWADYDWVIPDDQDYPRLVWESPGGQSIPQPQIVPLAGSGTQADPYQIQTASNFALLSWYTSVLDKHLRLMDDLDLSGILLYPIGDLGQFTGVFEGNGHVIHNAVINQPGSDYVGLFGYMGSGGQICNLGVRGAEMTGRYFIGGLVGTNSHGTIASCYVIAEVSGVQFVGGLAGESEQGSTITSCFAAGTDMGSYHVGGLVGYNHSSVITSCYATGAVKGDGALGGLIGGNHYGAITSCYAVGAVTGSGTSIGGLAGFNGYGTITSCFWDTQTSGQDISAGGAGKTTAEMQTQSTFTDAGWDFIGEDINGTEDIWMMCGDGVSYPKLWWESINCKHVIYVDENANPSGDGSSWETAYKYLQDALHDPTIVYGDEIWVAEGTYYPDEDEAGNVEPNDRTASFELINGVALYGGFPRGGGDWEDRDSNMRETTLSGDLAKNDGSVDNPADLLDDPNRAENSYHVITSSGSDETTILDGFTVTAGNANGSYPYYSGGGLYNCDGSITGCTISGNSAYRGGGFIYCDGLISRCIIKGNVAEEYGGGLDMCYDATISHCIISGNSADWGGGLSFCNGLISHCIISGNSADRDGGGLGGCAGSLSHCTITGNSAIRGGGIQGIEGSIHNCIIWNNLPSGWTWGCTPMYNCVEGGSDGVGCINADPCFVNSGNWDGNRWMEGDYHLQPNSPCIDTGSYYYDMHLPSADLDGNTRKVGSQVDMGCFEFGGTKDSDGDWLADAEEWEYTNLADRDNDEIVDGIELLQGTDPNSPDPLGEWHVPGDAQSIQEALFFSRSGETIILNIGTYYENVYIGGRDVILTSTDPNNSDIVETTIIDADVDQDPTRTNGRPITLAGTETEDCYIQGLTLINGSGIYLGGGIYGNECKASVLYCTIRRNTPRFGGGLYGCHGTISHCNIISNSASGGGGLNYCNGTISHCIIKDNSASSSGGGLRQCFGFVNECTINGNSADYGGAIFECSGSLINCRINSNYAESEGGALSCRNGRELLFINCIFADNSAEKGNGFAFSFDGSSSEVELNNCILWNGGDEIWNNDDSTINISYSDVQGSWPGEGNIDVDPLFADPNNGDFHLKSQAGRWDPNSQSWVYDEVTSRCIDAGNPGMSIGDEYPDPNNIRINMGAYGGTAEASRSPFNWSIISDINNDGVVEITDYTIVSGYFGQTGENLPGDFNHNGIVNVVDLAYLAANWLKTTVWYMQ